MKKDFFVRAALYSLGMLVANLLIFRDPIDKAITIAITFGLFMSVFELALNRSKAARAKAGNDAAKPASNDPPTHRP